MSAVLLLTGIFKHFLRNFKTQKYFIAVPGMRAFHKTKGFTEVFENFRIFRQLNNSLINLRWVAQ